MNNAFVHLHVHSEYSVADGIVRLQPLASTAAEYRLPAVALTDLSNVHGMVKFYRACMNVGVKPLIGSDVWVENPIAPDSAARMILLCRSHRGYQNLGNLLTRAYQQKKKDKAIIAWDDMRASHQDLLVLFDDHEGPLTNLPSRGGDEIAGQLIKKYQELFADGLYFQVSRIGHVGEQEYIHRAAHLACVHSVGLVATNRVEFITTEEFDAHEIRICIHEGRALQDTRRQKKFTEQQYLRNGDEMVQLFADLPEAITNTVEVAKRCNLFLDFSQNFLPAYPDAGDKPEEQLLRDLAEQGLCRRLQIEHLRDDNADKLVGTADLSLTEYTERLDLELGVIAKMGFSGYFLIVADFIRWSRQNDIPVGPGRGSGAGSLVAWATGITEIDPLHYGLLFERFLNPERVSLPDFDIDFCVDGRDRVIDYVAERYGRNQVSQIITFGTMAAKAVVRDVGRVMSMPYGFVDQIAKLIPFEIGITLEKALKQEQLLKQRYDESDEVRELFDNALQLEGIARNVGTHAGGVVIAPRSLSEYTPLYVDTRTKQTVTQLDKDDLEAIGLVKFDFLGLRTLTIIDNAVKMINQRRDKNQPSLDMNAVPLDDTKTYELIKSGRTKAIFQIESRGICELILRLLPDQFDDLVALVALYRPGPLQSGMVDDFIDCKHGRKPVTFPHPQLAPILKPTYGVILYQEQVMQIAQELAGYSLGGSDLLRAAMGKKKIETMNQQREVFRAGAVERGVKPELATRIFDLMEKFAGYGFNKSHSVAYALIAYHTAWLKAHHPAAFMAATLTADLDNTDKVSLLLVDCKEIGLTVVAPDINECGHGFRAMDEKTILYGLGAVKGVGGNVSEVVENERKNGKFGDLFDFCRRLASRTINKRVVEALIKCGAMDNLGEHRAALLADVDSALQAAEQQISNQTTGQFDIFGSVEVPEKPQSNKTIAKWSEQQRLAAEKDTLGLYLSGHPYDAYRTELSSLTTDIESIDLNSPKSGIFAGLIFAMRVIKTKRGEMAFITLDNARVRVEVTLLAKQYQLYRPILQKETVLVVSGEFSMDDSSSGIQMRAETVKDLDKFRSECLRHIHIELGEQEVTEQALSTIQKILTAARGGKVEITLGYQRKNGESGTIKLGSEWQIEPTPQTIETLLAHFGTSCLRLEYDASSLHNTTTNKYNGKYTNSRNWS